MSFNLLKGKRGIIFGALNDASIAWKVAERVVEEGAQIVLTNTAVACRMGTIDELAKKTNATIIPADATSVEDLNNLFVKAQEALGGKIDFVLHSCAMSVNMRKKRTYDDLDYGFLDKTLDISAISFHKMLQVAKKLDALNEGASVLALTYVASHRTFFGYNDMADAKSLLESIARSFGYIYGREKKVRINTISQSPTFTTAGSGIKGFDGLYDFSDRMSPLGNASADECADWLQHILADKQSERQAEALSLRPLRRLQHLCRRQTESGLQIRPCQENGCRRELLSYQTGYNQGRIQQPFPQPRLQQRAKCFIGNNLRWMVPEII